MESIREQQKQYREANKEKSEKERKSIVKIIGSGSKRKRSGTMKLIKNESLNKLNNNAMPIKKGLRNTVHK